jgi:pimeloyl-ACP methyl ester carboxylesterase
MLAMTPHLDARTIDFVTSLDGTRICYESAGSGSPALVFAHGWTCNRHFWDPQVTHFAANHRVVALDLGGHGDSEMKREDYTYGSFSQDLCTILEHLDLTDCVLVGHSMGGAVALEAARLAPARIASVVMVDTFVFDYGRFTEDQVDAFIETFDADFPGAILNLVRDTCKPESDPAWIADVAKEMSKTPKHVGLSALKALLTWDPDPAFADVKVGPIYWLDSDMINEDARKRYGAMVNEVVMAGTGHFLQMEDPERFNRLLADLLKS